MATPLLTEQLPARIQSVWAIGNLFSYGIPAAILLSFLTFLPRFMDLPSLPDPFRVGAYSLVGLLGLLLVIALALIPLRYRYTRYEVRPTEVVFQTGVFFRTTTYVPIIRVQHVEVEQGPLLRAHGLAAVLIHTAATRHSFAGLDHTTAQALRDQILRLVKEHTDGL